MTNQTNRFFKTGFKGLFCLCLMVFAVVAAPSYAQDENSGATLDKRLELARKMHDLRPAKPQVYSAIDRVAQSQPSGEREAFRTAMRQILNYQAIENASIEAMAETYTAEELEAMVAYYSQPVAQSAAKKDMEYSSKVYPEIIRMLDQAMMRLKTGGQ